MVHITALLMVKNESKRIGVTLESLNVDCIDRIAVYDTGSGDNTLDICRDFTFKELVIKEGPWINFEYSRNKSIEWVESLESCEWILLLDANDELKNYENLRDELENMHLMNGFKVEQEWEEDGIIVKYENVKVIKGNRGWRYDGVVHEQLTNDNIIIDNLSIILYQNRNEVSYKCNSRLEWDRYVLTEVLEKEESNGRVMYYLAETNAKLQNYEEALSLYTKRSEMLDVSDERYMAYLNCGHMNVNLNKGDVAIEWFTKACIYLEKNTGKLQPQPFIEIGKLYRIGGFYSMSIVNLQTALKLLDNISDKNLIISRICNELSLSAWFNSEFELGFNACKKVIECNIHPYLTSALENFKIFPQNLAILQHCYYINLEERVDRKIHVEKEMKKLGVFNYTRFNAIKYNLGLMGCLESHIRVLEQFLQLENAGEFVTIFEDDVQFLKPDITIQGLIKLEKDPDWDVLMLGGSNQGAYKEYKNLPCIQVEECHACTAYIVRNKYIPTLLSIWTERLDLFLNSNENNKIENMSMAPDIIWQDLQIKDTFLLLTPLVVTQIPNYSNNVDQFTNHNNAMLNLVNKQYNIIPDIETIPIPYLIIKKSSIPNAGQGVYTEKFIPKNTAVCEYKGKIIDETDITNISNSDYLLSLDNGKFIDASDIDSGIGRYMNDSKICKTNNCMYAKCTERMAAYIITTRDIYPYEELFVSYGAPYWQQKRNIDN